MRIPSLFTLSIPMFEEIDVWSSEENAKWAIIGGILIGLSNLMAYLIYGRSSGISNKFYTLIRGKTSEGLHWVLPYFAGMILITAICGYTFGSRIELPLIGVSIPVFDPLNTVIHNVSFLSFGIGGLCVGIGTRMCKGDMTRYSMFLPTNMCFTGLFAFITYALGASLTTTYPPSSPYFTTAARLSPDLYSLFKMMKDFLLVMISICALISIITRLTLPRGEMLESPIALAEGALFGSGLMLAGFLRPTRLKALFTFTPHWDPSLLLGILAAWFVGYLGLFIKNKLYRTTPLLGTHYDTPPKSGTRGMFATMLGGVIYGFGVGITGYADGNGLIYMFMSPQLIIFVLAMGIGMFLPNSARKLFNLGD